MRWASFIFSCMILSAWAGILDPAGGPIHSLYPPQTDLVAWYNTNDGTSAVARVGTDALVVNRPCLTMATNDTITVSGLAGTEAITHDGTAVLAAASGQINVTSAGTVANISIDGELTYPSEEGQGATLYSVSTNWSDATIVSPTAGIATVRSGTCDEASWNAQYGHSPASVFNGVDDWVDTDYVMNFGTNSYRIQIDMILDGPVTASLLDGRDVSGDGIHILRTGYSITIRHNAETPLALDISQYLDGNMHSVLFVKDSSEECSLYIDGVFIGSKKFTTSISTTSNMEVCRSYWNGEYLAAKLFRVYAHGNSAGIDLRPSTTTNGMVDTITGNVYTNAGTGDLGLLRIPALADGSADATGGAIQYGTGFAHNGADFDLVFPAGTLDTGAVTNTLAQIQTWNGETNIPIDNIYIYTNTPASYIDVIASIPPYSGVYIYPVLTNLNIVGDASITESNSAQYAAWAEYENGPSNNVASSATWATVSGLANVTLNSAGLVTVGDRDTTNNFVFSATFGGLSDTNTVSIIGTPEAPPMATLIEPTYYLPDVADLSWASTFEVTFSTNTPTATFVPYDYLRQGSAGDVTPVFGASTSGSTQAWEFVAEGFTASNTTTYTFTDIGEGVVIPTNAPDEVIFFARADGTNLSRTLTLNRAIGWFVNPDIAEAGDKVYIGGQNFKLQAGDTPRVYVEEEDEWLVASYANSNRIEITIPSGYTNGTYTLHPHNGRGGKYGSDIPLSLTVNNLAWTTNTFNIWDYGGVADDGVADDSAFAAVVAASGAGDTIVLSNGVYELNARFRPTSLRKWTGQGMTNTVIQPTATNDFPSSFPLVEVAYDGAWWSDMTLSTGTDDPNAVLRVNSNDQMKFTNMKFIMSGTSNGTGDDTIYTSLADSLTFSNCDFVVSFHATADNGCRNFTFKDCDFYATEDSGSFWNASASTDFAFLDCTGQHLDNSDPDDPYGWGTGRFVNTASAGLRGLLVDNLVTTNFSTRIGLNDGDDNEGELILQEGGATSFEGLVVSATSNTATFASPVGLSSAFDIYSAMVTKGTALGFCYPIDSIVSNTITIHGTWEVEPSTDSWISIGTYGYRWAVVNSYHDGSSTGAVDTASALTQTTGGMHTYLCINNTAQEIRTGVYLQGEGFNNFISPNYLNLAENNTFSKLEEHVYTHGAYNFSGSATNTNYRALGNVLRHNTSDTVFGDGHAISLSDTDEEGFWGLEILQGNYITNSFVGPTNYTPSTLYDSVVDVGNTFTLNPNPAGNLITNPQFDSDISGWNNFSLEGMVWSGGELETTGSGTDGAYQNFLTVAGKAYSARVDLTSTTGEVNLRMVDGGTPDAGFENTAFVTTPQTLHMAFIAQSTNTMIYLRHNGSGTATWDNVAVIPNE